MSETSDHPVVKTGLRITSLGKQAVELMEREGISLYEAMERLGIDPSDPDDDQ